MRLISIDADLTNAIKNAFNLVQDTFPAKEVSCNNPFKNVTYIEKTYKFKQPSLKESFLSSFTAVINSKTDTVEKIMFIWRVLGEGREHTEYNLIIDKTDNLYSYEFMEIVYEGPRAVAVNDNIIDNEKFLMETLTNMLKSYRTYTCKRKPEF